MSEGQVTVELRGHVLMMGLSREAKRNAFDLELYRALARAYKRLDDDPEARVGVLFAHGAHFTAGLDLAAWTPVFASGAWDVPSDGLDPLGLAGQRVSKPVVCAVSGICFTIGIELLLATDVRVAADDVRLGQIEIKRGIFPVGGATVRLPREIGWSNAMRYLLTGDELGAAEAHRIGLVQEVTRPGEHVARAVELATRIAAQAPLGVQATLQSARAALPTEEGEEARRLLERLGPMLASDDAREGLASFVERRAAVFTGR
ncbi:MAG: crotonase/enoyl-CoA hydratase family protein [Polyangiaceae bacterium]|nr:crotonase/enoyl-CoA hydratase family protein [Polyangiaceae bacterium]